MKSPRDKYMHDPAYAQLVNILTDFIERAEYTPSELREACILACINYEMRHRNIPQMDPRVLDALETLDKFTSRKTRG